ncbi:MAG: hypothetical protein H6P98_3123, partial [Candidatus Aminicenantes bacterium]|nr:hypothetical protein [Candidatus Aminicenantes bacterium]
MKTKYFALLLLVCLAAYSCKSNTASEPKNPPTIALFSASPDTVFKGDTATLRWSITGAATASIDQGIGSIAAEGQRDVTPTATVTYTLTAGNADGTATKTATVTIKEKAEIVLDGQPTFTYSSSNKPMLTGYVRNIGAGAGYNCKIEFRAYSDDYKTIIDTSTGYPNGLGNINPGQQVYYDAVFNKLDS